MIYSEDFVKRVKNVFPHWESLHEKLDTDSVWVGRYLDDSRHSISTNDILNAKSLEELQERALREKTISDLCAEWQTLYNAIKSWYEAAPVDIFK